MPPKAPWTNIKSDSTFSNRTPARTRELEELGLAVDELMKRAEVEEAWRAMNERVAERRQQRMLEENDDGVDL